MDSSPDDSPQSNVQNFYLKSLLSVNYTTPKPTSDYTVWQDPDTEEKLVEVVGILAALAISAMIIVGVAFVMSKLRKRGSEGAGNDAVSEVQVDSMTSHPHTETGVPHYAIKHVYSISGLTWEGTTPPEKRTLKQMLTPKFMKNKPAPSELPVVHEKVKKGLSMIYVY